ncbi:farnesyl-diphosphate farnesyltransferase [Halosimplex carlsbadense 2-9-1]|uniref:Farnesyl-diphosphate farnesyltransferase n=1 Tax=Halosimplex carlsbadense 2-9-1 TaxID=797114 RepID=M0CNQ2_9EURY|nr:phytoene/squalene synthase family protein [Halosimplex carlsbadense]ELZ24876.1 farnesyl-diphosphate farnesyltransferase [Halosimplex carlsbadense 2-9-1]
MSRNQTEQMFQDDLDYCYDAVQDVSRTFALTVAELDEPMSRDICVGYLLCRIADTVEDAGHIPPAEQRTLLDLYNRVLDPEDDATVAEFRAAVDEWIPESPNDDWEVVAQSPRVFRAFDGLDDDSQAAIRPPVRELVSGMAMFVERYAEQGGLRLQTFGELEEYCWYAAGTVGTLVTGLLSRNVDDSVSETLQNNARSFAMLLQLVNVSKDVATDFEEENNVYIPQELLNDQQLDTEDIRDGDNGEEFVPVIRRVVDRAEGYLDGAQTWLEAMPEIRGNTLSAWAIPFLLAVGTLRELEERPEDVIEEGDVKVSRSEVTALFTMFSGEDDPSVAELRSKMRQQPLDEY